MQPTTGVVQASINRERDVRGGELRTKGKEGNRAQTPQQYRTDTFLRLGPGRQKEKLFHYSLERERERWIDEMRDDTCLIEKRDGWI